MSLDYFRRPLLAGKNLPRLASAVIRGSLRRANPGSGVLVPHFDGVVADMTLKVKFEDGVERTATLTGNGFQQILDDINAAITTHGRAFDSDGCLAIQTLLSGGLGSVEITGGTAAALVGFDLKSGVPMRVVGGDLASVSEGRNGSPFGTVFPPKNENLSSDSYRIAMGRIAGNLDLLFSDLSRRQARLSKAGDIVLANQAGGFAGSPAYGLLTLPPGAQVYSGLGHLSRLSSKEDLAPYFLLVDKKTKQPSASRVVAVVKGAVAGTLDGNGVLNPFADATTSDGNGNVLGILNPRFSPASGITSIKNGRIIQSAAGTFTKVKVGDWVKIDGIDDTINKDPWDNRGLRWVVEEIIGVDGDTIAVRPMSKTELTLAGTTVKDAQPVVELNDQKTGNQVFGTVQAYAGTFIDDPKLVVSPPISDDVELWAAAPMSYRDLAAKEDAYASAVFARMLMRDQSDLPDSLLTVPTLTMSGTAGQDDRTITVGEFYIRWKGQVIRVAGGAINIGPQRANDVWVYLDKKALFPMLSTGPGAATAAFAQLPIAYFPPGAQAVPNYIGRIQETKAQTVYVGEGGQFAKLEDAVEYFNQSSFAGVPRYEIVVVSDVTVPVGGITVKRSGLHIRGASRSVKILRTPGDNGFVFTLDNTYVSTFNLTDLAFEDLAAIWTQIGGGAAATTYMSRVTDASLRTYALYNSSSYYLGNDLGSVYLKAWNGKTLDIGDGTPLFLGHATDANVYTTVRSKLKANRTAEIIGGLFVGDPVAGTGDASFYGNVYIGQAGKVRALNITGNLTVTGAISLGSAGGTASEFLSKLLAKGGLDVGTAAVPADATVYGNLVVGQAGNPKSATVNGPSTVSGTATFKDDIDAYTQSPVGKGNLKGRALQVAGATGTNVDSTGKLTVGGAGKGYMATDGEVGNANAKIDATGKLTAKTAQVGGAAGVNIDANGNTTVGAGAGATEVGPNSVRATGLMTKDANGNTQAVIASDGSASFKKKVTVDPSTAPAGSKVFDTGVAFITKEGNIDASSISIDEYSAAGIKGLTRKLLQLIQNNPSLGSLNPLVAGLRRGRKLYGADDFRVAPIASPVNAPSAFVYPNFQVYNNTPGSTAVSLTRMARADAPNRSGQAIKISNSGGLPAASPGLGGFVASTMAKLNSIFVQTFKALIPVGYTLYTANNFMGDGAASYWLTDSVGTGRWEEYAVIWICGNGTIGGALSTFGHIYLNGPAGAVDWYLASSLMYEVTDEAVDLPIVDMTVARTNTTPNDYDNEIRATAKRQGDLGLLTEGGVQATVMGVAGSPLSSQELAFQDGVDKVYYRRGGRGGAWGSWSRFVLENSAGYIIPTTPTSDAAPDSALVDKAYLKSSRYGSLIAAGYVNPDGTYDANNSFNISSIEMPGWVLAGGTPVNGYYRIHLNQAAANYPASIYGCSILATPTDAAVWGDITSSGGDQSGVMGPIFAGWDDWGNRILYVRPTAIFTNTNYGNYLGRYIWRTSFYFTVFRHMT